MHFKSITAVLDLVSSVLNAAPDGGGDAPEGCRGQSTAANISG